MIKSLILTTCMSMLLCAVGCGGQAGGPVVTDPTEAEKYSTPENYDASKESSPS